MVAGRNGDELSRRDRPEEESALLESPEERDAREAVEKAVAEQNRLNAAFMQNLMANETFRAWVMWILTGLGTFDNLFGVSANGFPDHEATQFLMGKKAAGWFMYTYFDSIAPEMMSRARREATPRA